MTTELTAIAQLRKIRPTMRRTRATAIIHSGGRQTIYGCVCGARHTTSTDWNGRDAKHVREWRDEHAACAARVLETLTATATP
jgi:hypothetical protein